MLITNLHLLIWEFKNKLAWIMRSEGRGAGWTVDASRTVSVPYHDSSELILIHQDAETGKRNSESGGYKSCNVENLVGHLHS